MGRLRIHTEGGEGFLVSGDSGGLNMDGDTDVVTLKLPAAINVNGQSFRVSKRYVQPSVTPDGMLQVWEWNDGEARTLAALLPLRGA